jgi:SAM-dependent methyltransferase
VSVKDFFRKLRRVLAKLSNSNFATSVPLPLPDGVSEAQLFEFVTAVRVSDAPEAEMKAYGTHDFKRFVYTLGLANDLRGTCLELGANPYFTTMLLKQFTQLDLSLANYFGPLPNGPKSQAITFRNFHTREPEQATLQYQHFNVENDVFPFADNSFDIVIFAEIIEHLLNDPCKVLREIHRVLKPQGRLILTTPNVARFENVAKMIAGENIYDPYSGYGPYGRHNREYNRHELIQLLQFEGFIAEQHFTADVHANHAAAFTNAAKLNQLVRFRSPDLGQYIFIRAYKNTAMPTKRPNWLYRSYPAGELI